MNQRANTWEEILGTLKENLSPKTYDTFFKNSRLANEGDDQLTVAVGTDFAADYLNKNYVSMVADVLYKLYARRFTVQFTSESMPQPEAPETQSYFLRTQPPKLDKKYTFDDFVVGESNNFAHSAAIAVAEAPGQKYNPLFIYGESGMGKTHLMQAIGHYVYETNPAANVYYTTTEAFMNEMIEYMQKGQMNRFRSKFRSFNLLLIDDIHFLSRKEGTQEEFFHTFNSLYENKNQIVMTSDRPPKEIPDLEKRLVTRFEWGLLADLKPPNFETRVAILKKKCAAEGVNLAPDVADFVAESIYNNVRVLEGALTRIMAHCSVNKIEPYDLDQVTVREVLKHLIKENISEISLDLIMEKVCASFNLTPSMLMDKTKKRNIAQPRQVGMYLSNMLMPHLSLKEVACFYKRKDHTTVLHAREKLEHKYKKEEDFRQQIDDLLKEIRG